MKINGKDILEFKSIEDLGNSFEKAIYELAQTLLRKIDNTTHFMTGFPAMDSGFKNCATMVECYKAILQGIDEKFGTHYTKK